MRRHGLGEVVDAADRETGVAAGFAEAEIQTALGSPERPAEPALSSHASAMQTACVLSVVLSYEC